MANYFVRVELFGASANDYEELHKVMEGIGLKRTIAFEGGKLHEMPTGTYFGANSLDSGVLRERLKVLSKPLSPGRDAAIFACEAHDQKWAAFLYSV